MHQKITITQPWASSTTAQIWWTPKISLCSFFALQYMLVLDVNVFLLEKWQYVTKMLLFYCRTEIPKLDLKSARVPVSQLFKKTALVKIKAAESLRRFVNLTSFKSVWQQSWDLLVVVQLLALSSETNSLCQENPPSSQESTRTERWNNPSQLSPWLQPPWTWQVVVVVHLEFQSLILKTKKTGCDGLFTLITYLCYNCNMDSIPHICFQFECIYKSLRVYRSSITLKGSSTKKFSIA